MSLPSMVDTLWQKCKEVKWGAWTLVMLLVSVFTGIILALQYDFATPWYSTTAIELLAPYGSFFRSLHFYSSQFFFCFSIFHFLNVYNKAGQYPIKQWLRLVSSFPLALLLLFTGYVLRGDATGNSAGNIAENLLLSIPLIGDFANNFFFSLTESGLRKVYVHHVIGFDLLLLLLLWRHLHTYRVFFTRYFYLIVVVCVFSMLVSAPLEMELPGVRYISGPWFFLGLQELLRYFPPIIAGVVIPLLFVMLLCLCHPGQKRARLLTMIFLILLVIYGALSIIALVRG